MTTKSALCNKCLKITPYCSITRAKWGNRFRKSRKYWAKLCKDFLKQPGNWAAPSWSATRSWRLRRNLTSLKFRTIFQLIHFLQMSFRSKTTTTSEICWQPKKISQSWIHPFLFQTSATSTWTVWTELSNKGSPILFTWYWLFIFVASH